MTVDCQKKKIMKYATGGGRLLENKKRKEKKNETAKVWDNCERKEKRKYLCVKRREERKEKKEETKEERENRGKKAQCFIYCDKFYIKSHILTNMYKILCYDEYIIKI